MHAEQQFHIVEDSAGHLLLKKIIRGESAICAAAVKEGKEQPGELNKRAVQKKFNKKKKLHAQACAVPVYV